MYHLIPIPRLASAALRWLRQPPVKPSCRRPALELLPDRVLPSLGLVGSVHPDDSVDLADPEIQHMRFMEIPQSGPALQYWKSGAFSLSAKPA